MALLALCLGACRAHAQPGADQRLFDLYYAFEVTAYCSLVDERVTRGFAARAGELRRRSSLDDDALSNLRGKAWQAAHAEWQNRGLGGFRTWCRDEGRQHADELAGHAPPRGDAAPPDLRR